MLRAVIAAATVVAVFSAAPQAGLEGTSHDFSNRGHSNGELCLPCHTPHDSDATVGYLWNREPPADADFTKRDDAVLGAETLTCLSCHDGQTAMGGFGQQAGNGTMTGSGNITRNLLNDHPVGVEYPWDDTPGAHNRYAQPTTTGGDRPGIDTGSGEVLPLWTNTTNGKDQVECATCHDPHTSENSNFLRMPNTGSELCIACHVSW